MILVKFVAAVYLFVVGFICLWVNINSSKPFREESGPSQAGDSESPGGQSWTRQELLCGKRLILSGSICISCTTWNTEGTLLCGGVWDFWDTLYLYSIKLGQLLCWDDPRGSYTFPLKRASRVLLFSWFLCPNPFCCSLTSSWPVSQWLNSDSFISKYFFNVYCAELLWARCYGECEFQLSRRLLFKRVVMHMHT